jgi:hypothetical protein
MSESFRQLTGVLEFPLSGAEVLALSQLQGTGASAVPVTCPVTVSQLQGGAAGSGSLAIQQVARPATVACDTEGSLDWLNTNLGFITQGLQRVAKILGGPRIQNFRPLGSGSPETYTDSATELEWTGIENAPLTAGNTHTGISNPENTLGCGFTFDVEALNAPRVLRIYAGVVTGSLTLTAMLTDGSAEPATSILVDPASPGTGTQTMFEISYQASQPCKLLIALQLTATTGSAVVESLGATLGII